MDYDIERGEHHGMQDTPETIPSLEDIKKSIKEDLPLHPVAEILASLDKNLISPPREFGEFDGIDIIIEEDCFFAAACGDLRSLTNFTSTFGKEKILSLKSVDECSLLHCASSRGHSRICEYLIVDLKFDVNMKDIEGNTPLHFAAHGIKWKISKPRKKYGFLVFAERPEDFIRSEAVGDQIETIRVLFDLGADINALNFAEQSALHFAALAGNIGTIDKLIKHGCKAINNPTTDYGTPLRSAASVDEVDALEYLLKKGAKTNIVWDGCLSPLLSALMNNSKRCAEKLILNNADVNYSAHRMTPLEVAILYEEMDIFKSLLKEGAKTNCQDIYGLMPIELAAVQDNSDMVGILLDRTSPIDGIEDWSVDGVMDHCHSEEFQTKLDMKKKDALSYFLSEGDNAYEAKKYHSAMTWYLRARDIDKDHASYFARRSLCYAGLKYSQGAIDDLFHSMKLNPNSHLLCYAKGVVWSLRKIFKCAAESFEQAYKLAPDEAKQRKYQDALRVALKNHLNSSGIIL